MKKVGLLLVSGFAALSLFACKDPVEKEKGDTDAGGDTYQQQGDSAAPVGTIERWEYCTPTMALPNPCVEGLECVLLDTSERVCMATCEEGCLTTGDYPEACQDIDELPYAGYCLLAADYYEFCGDLSVCPAGSMCDGYYRADEYNGTPYEGLTTCQPICDEGDFTGLGTYQEATGASTECPTSYPYTTAWWASDITIAPKCVDFPWGDGAGGIVTLGACAWGAAEGSWCDESAVVCCTLGSDFKCMSDESNAVIGAYARPDTNTDEEPATVNDYDIGQLECGIGIAENDDGAMFLIGECMRACLSVTDCSCPTADPNCETPVAPKAYYCAKIYSNSDDKFCQIAKDCTASATVCSATEDCVTNANSATNGLPAKICQPKPAAE